MPTETERQIATDALHRAFLVNLIAETEAALDDLIAFDSGSDSDSDSDSSDFHPSASSNNSFMSSDSSDSEMYSASSLLSSNVYLDSLAHLYSQRYLNQHEIISKSSALLYLLLHDWKFNRPDVFCSYLQIDPDCFDSLVEVIKDDPIFHNKSNNSQMPVEEQTAIALY